MDINLRKKAKVFQSEDVYPVFGKSQDPNVSTVWYHVRNRKEAEELAGNADNQNLLKETIYYEDSGFICIETDRITKKERVLYTVCPLDKCIEKIRRFVVRFPKNDLLAADLMHVHSQNEIASGCTLLKEPKRALTPENMFLDKFYEFDLVRPDRYFGEKITKGNSGDLLVTNTVTIGNNTWYRLSQTPVIQSKIRVMNAVEHATPEICFAWIRKNGKKYVITTGTEKLPSGHTLFSLTKEESAIMALIGDNVPACT